MTIPVSVTLWSQATGEIFADNVINDFTTTQFEHKEKLYRWIDCLLRAVDKGVERPVITISCFKYPKQPTLF